MRTLAFVSVVFGSSPCMDDPHAATHRPLSVCAPTFGNRTDSAASIAAAARAR
jgi:hypothetical protein